MATEKALERAILFVEEFRKVDTEMPMQTAAILLQVAKKPGMTMMDLSKAVGLGKSAVSRNVAKLSDEFGKGLLTFREDLMDRRNKVVHLTPEGERTLRTLLHYTGAE